MSAAPIGSYQDLLALLEREGVTHESEPATKSVFVPTLHAGIEGVQNIRWQDSDGVIQFIQSTPFEGIPAERLPATAEAVLRLNHALAIPGLNVDYARGLISFRTILPIFPRGAVEAPEIQAMFRLTVKTAMDLVPTLRRVIAGETAAADALTDAQRELAAASAAPPSA